MSGFTTRVELHDATRENYEVLHDAMAREGFKRTIASDNGTVYRLPLAEYDFEGTISANSLLVKAQAAATRTGKAAAILVTEALRRTWSGLKQD